MSQPASLDSTRYPSPKTRAAALLKYLRDSTTMDYIGEPISQLEHALQAAACGVKSGSPIEVVLGALFHDIGHLIAPDAPTMEGLGVLNHEGIGADLLLEFGCSQKVASLVRNHVEAKRYLCFKKSRYLAKLSEASLGTLTWQGGPMTPQEAAEFEAHPHFNDILTVRAWDEQAKDPDATVPSLDYYQPLLVEHLSHSLSSGAHHV